MNNQIARTVVNGYVVSTVKLTDPFGVYVGGEYETMVFPADANGEVADWTERDCQRYGNMSAALEGHEVMVAAWALTYDPDSGVVMVSQL
jgi:hypothetical protein